MSHFLIAVLLHILPALLTIILFFLIFDVSFRTNSPKQSVTKEDEPDVQELEKQLQKLIENNMLSIKAEDLRQELSQTPTQTISAYLQQNKKNLKGFHLFQLIFSLIKNGTENTKIIKILRHYLPSCSTSHLYALLKSCKEFLNLSQQDGVQKELIKDLNQNRLKSTLLYLQHKLNQILNQIANLPPAEQQSLIDKAVIYGLIFATFSEFYNTRATEKILRLCNMLSPKLFRYWHESPPAENIFSKKHQNSIKKHRHINQR